MYSARNSAKLKYLDGISEVDFVGIVNRYVSKFKRIKKYTVNNGVLSCSIESIRGQSCWQFKIDFNDWGHLTGKHWITSGNFDSTVPKYLATLISDDINKLHCFNNSIICYDNIVTDNESFFSGIMFQYKDKRLKYIGRKIKIEYSFKELILEHPFVLFGLLIKNGFVNISSEVIKDVDDKSTNHPFQIKYIEINGITDFKKFDYFPKNSKVVIAYHHKKEIKIPFGSNDCRRKDYLDIVRNLKYQGFVNINLYPIKDLKYGIIFRNGAVQSVSINNCDNFEKHQVFKYDANISIWYHTFQNKM